MVNAVCWAGRLGRAFYTEGRIREAKDLFIYAIEFGRKYLPAKIQYVLCVYEQHLAEITNREFEAQKWTSCVEAEKGMQQVSQVVPGTVSTENEDPDLAAAVVLS